MSLKIAIVCYGHFDATLALAKYLPRLHSGLRIHLIFLLDQSESISVENVDFQGYRSENGFVEDDVLRTVLGPEIYTYIHPTVELRAFIFNSIRLADLKNWALLQVLREDLVKQNFDLIHFVGNNNDWIVKLNRTMQGIPKIHTMHEPYPFSPLSVYRAFRYRWTIQQLLNTSSTIVVPSEISRNRLEDHFKTDSIRVEVIPFETFEIYTAYGRSDLATEANLLLYYGSIVDYKGVPDLIEVMRSVQVHQPEIRCIIAGAGRLPRPLDFPTNTQLINRYLSNCEIADLNRRAALVVCPYRSASQSGVVMTSFAFGNPILATAVGAFPEMIDHQETGYLVQPGSRSALAQAIISLFSQGKMLWEMQAAVRKRYVDNHRWEQICTNHLDLYFELTNAHTTMVGVL